MTSDTPDERKPSTSFDIASLRDLEARLAEAKEPDRELDRDIYEFVKKRRSQRVNHEVIADLYTESVDRAISLAERVLPGWQYVIAGPWIRRDGSKIYDAGIVEGDYSYQDLIDEDLSSGATPALALCLAIIRALIASNSNGGEQ